MVSRFFKTMWAELKADIISIKQMWIAYKFRKIKRKASRLRDKYRETVFVVRIDGRLVYTTKTAAKKMWRKGKLKRFYNFARLSKQALYITPPYHDETRI